MMKMKRVTKIGWVLVTFSIVLCGWIIASKGISKAEEATYKEVGGVMITADGSQLAGDSYISNKPTNAISDITIPATVTEIPNYYFKNATNITSITISGQNVKVGSYAFLNCRNLTSINLGAVDSIDSTAFDECVSLALIKVNSANYSVDGYSALYRGSTLVYVPPGAGQTYVVKNDATNIAAHALTYSNVKTISIPASVKSIGNQDGWLPVKVYTTEGSTADSYYESIGGITIITNGTDPSDDDDDGGDVPGGGDNPGSGDNPGGGDKPGGGDNPGGSGSSGGSSSGGSSSKGAGTGYSIIEGANQSVGSNSGTVTIKANGEFLKFAFVMVDGAIIDKTNYTAKSGSTVITFKADYIKSLSVGSHNVRVYYSDSGYAETTLTITGTTTKTTTTVTYTVNSDGTVTKGTGKDATPTTADGFDERMLLVLAILLCGIGTIIYSKNKKLDLISSGYDD